MIPCDFSRRALPLLAVLLAALALWPRSAPAQRRTPLDSAYLIVNDKLVTQREVDQLREAQQKELRSRLKGDELTVALKNLDTELTNRLIETMLLEIRAEELGITVNEKEINQRVEDILRRDAHITDLYSEEHLKDAVLKDVLRRQVMQREVSSRVRVDDDDIKRACKEDAGDDREVDVGHILLRGTDEATHEKVRALRRQIEAGEDFDKAALARSEDPSVSVNKGHLGFISRGQFVKEFEERAFAMKPGELSEPVRTQFGWHLIKVFAQRTKGKQNCDALDENARQRYATLQFNKMSEQRMAEFMDRMKKKADIRVVGR